MFSWGWERQERSPCPNANGKEAAVALFTQKSIEFREMRSQLGFGILIYRIGNSITNSVPSPCVEWQLSLPR